MEKISNIVAVDKPKGITSFDVIRILRKRLGVRKMGHSGTLDPRATGLLLIGIGEGTRELGKLIGLDKTYIATIQLGTKTATGDLEGEVIETKPVPKLSQDFIESEVRRMNGTHELAVPIYSAIKKGGKPLYDYAREGKAVDVPIKRMIVHSARLRNVALPLIDVEFHVSSGTYIRSLAEELGQRLGTVATLADLRRTSIGEYTLNGALKLE